ncbi:(2Fe-2S) ferredoxin domain-containing protein [Halocatena pleomorpha]|uniref:(2Fe-2S) ferredoxin domain-containing protein n=1 Tax=Halocatena pleomorpha TaxID=1785090 RepID=A0A3P3RJZ8_9EURY|nr:(2Fe-2S) ferredoxin domain-containing protein [Halocatena pleomorpha]RRJ33705.1 (2Fe-2S) ferredoxin domain-containing protein [Halocatena pleomorpha]
MNDRTAEVRANGFTDHVLVCTNDRESSYACCADAGAMEVYEAIKGWLRERGVFWSHVHVARTSCLGLCSEAGTAIVIHPRNRWYSDVQPEDVPDLLHEEFGADASQLGVRPTGES